MMVFYNNFWNNFFTATVDIMIGGCFATLKIDEFIELNKQTYF